MRNVNRVDIFMAELTLVWKTYFPDWRFGQLVCNFERDYGDLFYLEEDEFLTAIKEFANKYKRSVK